MTRKLTSALLAALFFFASTAQATIEQGAGGAPSADSNGNYQSVGLPAAQIITVTHSSSPYQIAVGNSLIFIDTTGGSVTVTFPNPSSNATIQIKDSKGNFATSSPTLQQFSGEKIEGLASSLTLNANWGNYKFQSDGTNWYKISAASNLASISFTAHGAFSWVAPAGITQVHLFGRPGAAGGAGGGGGGGGSTSSGA